MYVRPAQIADTCRMPRGTSSAVDRRNWSPPSDRHRLLRLSPRCSFELRHRHGQSHQLLCYFSAAAAAAAASSFAIAIAIAMGQSSHRLLCFSPAVASS
jgi:hypothetical protein